MGDNDLKESTPDTANHYWLPFLRYQRECEDAGKEVSVNEWMRETGKLDAKIAHEESAALAKKISDENEASAKKEIEHESLKKKNGVKNEAKTKTQIKQ